MPATGEIVVATTHRSEILSTRQGFYAQCTAGCPWTGAYRQYQATAEGDAISHDDDPSRGTWHTNQEQET